jgi:3-methyladenine DNA glycosylase AlkD
MKLSSKAHDIVAQIKTAGTKLGDLRNIAKKIKKNHDLAMELWSCGELFTRLLAVLIMDPKLLPENVLRHLDKDLQTHTIKDRAQLMDWLMANQLTKEKQTIALMESWEKSPMPLQRRAFWYYQGRLRCVGQGPPNNTDYLLSAIETSILKEEPEVQWAMNFTAGWIGIYDKKYRDRCIALGEKTELYKNEMVTKGCTPNYLPEFIKIEVKKRDK